MNWQKITPFKSKRNQQEIWIGRGNNYHKEHHVEVTFGKDIDILALKHSVLENFEKRVSFINQSRTLCYSSSDNLETVINCPVCSNSSDATKGMLNIYGAQYCQCNKCSHCYVLHRPSRKYLSHFYGANRDYQSTYTEKHSLKIRIDQIVIPQVKYVLAQYEKIYGSLPKSIVDVGAGSGYFVYACRKLGVSCEGIEISKWGRAFCKDNFDIELHNVDLLQLSDKFNCDIVTFWGVLEHLDAPLEILKGARNILNKQGMIASLVPRWNSLSTSSQTAWPESVTRHLDPLGHIQCFSDSSLATAFVLSGYDIKAAWYFGMDIYELITQLAYKLKENKIFDIMAPKISLLQDSVDLAKLSDLMVFIGISSSDR